MDRGRRGWQRRRKCFAIVAGLLRDLYLRQ